MPYYSIFSSTCSICNTERELFTDHLPNTGSQYSYLCDLCDNETIIPNANIGTEVDCLPSNSVVIKAKSYL
jgi:hypothetical protein